MKTQPLLAQVEADARAAGLPITNLARTLGPDDLGNCHVTGRVGSLCLRFVRDRGQDWLEIGPTDAIPPRFYSFQDAQIAFGWKSIEEVLDMRDVEPLGDVLKLLANRLAEIARALGDCSSSRVWKQVEKAADARAGAFAARLRSSP